MPACDAALLHRIASGETDALTELMTRHRGAVHVRVSQIVGDPTTAEDLTQETFLRAWTHAGSYRQNAGHGNDARPWLLRIGSNLALNHLRAAQRQPTSSSAPGDEPDRLSAPFEDPLDAVGTRELADYLRRAIEELPTGKRLVHEKYVEGMELRAIAEELGIPLGTAKSRLHYTRRHLAKAWRRIARQWEDDL